MTRLRLPCMSCKGNGSWSGLPQPGRFHPHRAQAGWSPACRSDVYDRRQRYSERFRHRLADRARTLVEVKPSHGLTDEDMERLLEESIDFAEEDIAQRLLIEARTEADTVLHAPTSPEPKCLVSARGRRLPGRAKGPGGVRWRRLRSDPGLTEELAGDNAVCPTDYGFFNPGGVGWRSPTYSKRTGGSLKLYWDTPEDIAEQLSKRSLRPTR